MERSSCRAHWTLLSIPTAHSLLSIRLDMWSRGRSRELSRWISCTETFRLQIHSWNLSASARSPVAAGRRRQNWHHEAATQLIISGVKRMRLPKFPPVIRNPLTELYGFERLSRMWSARLDKVHRICSERNGNICKDELMRIKANA